MAVYTLPELPYDYSALEPHISGRIMQLHHDKHHNTYVTGANTALDQLAEARDKGDFATINKLTRDLAFNLGGHVNHSVFWTNMSPDGGDKPTGELASAIDDFFGSFDTFRAQFTAAALGVQGSGWAALVYDGIGQRPLIVQFHDQQQDFPVGRRAAAAPGRLGARVLPRLRERPRRLREGVLEHRELGERGAALHRRPGRRRGAAATVVSGRAPEVVRCES